MDSHITKLNLYLNSIYQTPPSTGSLQWCKVAANNLSVAELEAPQTATFEQLVPTLIQCFSVILGGYLAGRFGLISGSEINGLNVFTSHISLPALIFLNLATLELGDVNWWFIASIFLGKLAVFIGVSLVTVLVGRPANLALAGIYGIFVSHSNDFGLAYPIVASLYGSTRPTYADYLYLIAPTSLMLINPIGFILMEAEKVRDRCRILNKSPPSLESGGQAEKQQSFLKKILLVFLGVLTNPNVFVTILGIAANFIFRGRLPDIVYGILKVFGSAFSCSVLFLLGLKVVGSIGHVFKNTGLGLFLPASLLIIKMVITPLVTRAWVSLLCSDSVDLPDLENYAFVYGIVPTGPVVLLFASQYGLPTEVLATTLVICTCVFGPVVFVVVKMVTLSINGEVLDYAMQMKDTLFWISVLGLLASIWVLVLFFVSGRWRRNPHAVTSCLLLSQVVMSVGVLFWASSWSTMPWTTYLQIATITGGQLASRLWTAVLAVTLVALQFLPSSIIKNALPYSLTVGIGLPLAASVTLLVCASSQIQQLPITNSSPLFLYGQNEAMASIIILPICLGVTLTCLLVFVRRAQHIFLSNVDPVVAQRKPDSKTGNKFQFLPKIYVSSEDDVLEKIAFENKGPSNCVIYVDSEMAENNISPNQAFALRPPDEKLSMSKIAISLKSPTSNEKWWSLGTLVYRPEKSLSSRDLLTEAEFVSNMPASTADDVSEDLQQTSDSAGNLDIQIKRHIILLALLSLSMMVGLTVSTWKIIVPVPSGITIAIEFLDSVLTFGQGLLVFAVFGIETNTFTRYLFKRIRSFRQCPPNMVQLLSLRQRKDSTVSGCYS